MVYLMIVQRSRAPERAMVFDVKQLKSLEGFLESGPQFVLQLYVLLHQKLEDGKIVRNKFIVIKSVENWVY